MKKFKPFCFLILFLLNLGVYAQSPVKETNRKVVLRAGLMQDCIGGSEQTFPYTPDFGLSGNPTTEKNYWSQKSLGGFLLWDYQTISGQGTKLYPYIPGYDPESDGARSTLYSHCLSLKSNERYTLRFTLVATKAGSNNHLKVSLAPKIKGSNEFVFGGKLPANSLLKDITNISAGSFLHEIDIEGAHIPTDSTYAIAFELLSDIEQGSVFIKDFSLKKIADADYALGELIAPLSNCNLSASEAVKIRFKNAGTKALNSVTAYYQIDGGTPVSQVFTLNNLASQKETILNFTTRANLSNKKIYVLKAWLAKNSDDENSDNDTLQSATLSSSNLSYAPPFNITFNTNAEREGWNILAKDFNGLKTWSFAGLENKYAEINTTADTANDWLLSPCIDLIAGKTYLIRFAYKALSTLGEHLQMHVSTDITNMESPAIWNRENFTSTAGDALNADGYMEASAYFTASQTNKHYIGFKAYSKEYRKGIAIDNIRMNEVTPFSVPFVQGFESETASKEIQVTDANVDGYTWQIITDANSAYNSLKYAEIKGAKNEIGANGQAGNDWLLMNPVKLQANKKYVLSYMVSGNSRDYYTAFIGKSNNYKELEKITDLKWENTPSGAYTQKSHTFTAPSTDVYYIAFKYRGEANRDAVFRLDNIILNDSAVDKDTNMALRSIVLPPNASTGTTEEKVVLEYRNLSKETLSEHDITFHYQLNGGKIFSTQAHADILPYQYGTVEFSDSDAKIDFRKGSTFHIKAWVSCKGDRRKDDDTITTTLTIPQPLRVPIKLDFESSEDYSNWSIAKTLAASPAWIIDSVNNPEKAYKGKGSLYAPTYVGVSSDFFISQSIQLSKDTTYCLRFYYAAGNQGNMFGPNLTVLYNFNKGKDISDFANLEDSIVDIKGFTNTDYRSKLKYFRVSADGKYYIAFKNYSTNGAKDFRIDNVLITDSLSAARSDLQITKLIPPSTQSCDLGADEKIHIEIQNNGIFDIENLPISIQFGSKSKILTEIVNLKISAESKTTYTLRTLWNFTGIDKDSVRIWLNLPSDINPIDDTTAFYVVERQAAQKTPFQSGFEATENFTWGVYDANTDNRTWNFASGSLSYAGLGYAEYTGDGSTIADDWLLSPCITLRPDSLYFLQFYYRTNRNANEKIEVYLLTSIRADSLLEVRNPRFILNNINNFNYIAFKDSLRVTKVGNYHIGFKICSDYAGQKFLLDNVSLRTPPPPPVDTICDIAVLSIDNPLIMGIMDSSENVSVSVQNLSAYVAKKVVLRCELNNAIVFADTIASLSAGQTLQYTFTKTLNLYTPGDYSIKVSSLFAKDTNPTNNTKEINLTSAYQDAGIEALVAPVKPPFSSKETIIFKIKNYGEYPLDSCPVIVNMNNMTYAALSPSVPVGESVEFSFPKTMNMLPNREYTFTIYTNAAKDKDNSNDTLHKLFVKFVDDSVANESIYENEKFVKIYPNPTKAYLHIQTEQNIQSIHLFDMQGLLKLYVEPANREAILDLQAYIKGNYVIRVKLKGGQIVSRTVVVI